MIKYKDGILEKLKEAGYTTYRIRKEKIFGEGTLQDFRRKSEIPIDVPNRLCQILGCRIEDIAEFVSDE